VGSAQQSKPPPPSSALKTRTNAFSDTDFHNGQRLFNRVRADIDQAENTLPQFSNGRLRFDRVRGQLSELQRRWDEGIYEPDNADAVILALNRALDTGGILPQDRDRLSDDMVQLRQFRDTHMP
jgi:hypothetical protein